MKISIDWIKNNFTFFNNKYFEGNLPVPKFQCADIGSGKLGLYELPGAQYDKRTGKITKVVNNGILTINSRFDRGEKDFQETLLHEMIHEYIYLVKRFVPKNLHGEMFMEAAKPMIADGFNIAESGEVNGENQEQQQQQNNQNYNKNQKRRTESVLCVVYKAQGPDYNYFFCRVEPSQIQQFKQHLMSLGTISDVQFFRCYSPRFAKLSSDLTKCIGFYGKTAYDVEMTMGRYFNESPQLFDIQKLQKIQ